MFSFVIRASILSVLILQSTSFEREESAIKEALNKLSSLAKNSTNHWLNLMKSTFDVEIEILGINHTLNSFLKDIQEKSDDAASRERDFKWCLSYGREKQLRTYANNATTLLRLCTRYHHATAVSQAREPMNRLLQAPQALVQATLDFWSCQNGLCDSQVFSKYAYFKSNITTLIEDTTYEITSKISETFITFGQCVESTFKQFLNLTSSVYKDALNCYATV